MLVPGLDFLLAGLARPLSLSAQSQFPDLMEALFQLWRVFLGILRFSDTILGDTPDFIKFSREETFVELLL